MSVHNRIAAMLTRDRAEEDFPALAYDEDSTLFLLEGAGKRAGYLGAVLYGEPVDGLDQTTLERLRGALSNNMPPGSFIQISLLATPDINAIVAEYLGARSWVDKSGMNPGTAELLDTVVGNRADLFLKGKSEPLVAGSGVKCNKAVSMVSVKVPIREPMPTDREIKETRELVLRLRDSLATFGLYLAPSDDESYIRTLRRIFHMHEDAVNGDMMDNRMLRDQVLGPGDRVTVSRSGVRVNDTHIGVLSVKRLPKRANLGMMNYFIGDPRGNSNQITEPYMMTLTLHYPDQAAKAASVRRGAQVINYQAYGPMLRWVPRLAYKKHGFDIMVHTMEEGAVLVEASFSLCLFARDEDALSRLVSATRTYYGSFGLEMGEERHISWPVFWNTLPLFPSEESIRLTHRFHSMAVKHAINFAPILSEWSGTGDGAAMMLMTRRGQPILYDLYDSDTNYNAVLFAESGAGKSFLTQQMIMDYLSKGAKIWVIDIGRSYQKLCAAVGGEFISFNPESRVCLNPFTEVEEIDEDLDVIKALLAKMASPQGKLEDYALGRLEEAIKAVWSARGNSMTITDVSDYLAHQEDTRLKDLSAMLYSFTRHGTYGSWFDGDANLDFNNNFVVLELEELASRKNLQQVVLLQLIAKIQHEMFLAKRGGQVKPRILVIDEAWDLLSDDGVAKFLETGYRRFRKYDGAALIVTQSVNDLYNSASGRAIAENSAHMLIMQQRAESIDGAKSTGRIGIGDYGFSMLKTVHTVPGRYSEVLLYSGTRGWGIGRLVVDRFSQVLFSTKGAERYEVLGDIERGVPVVEAVNNYIERNG